MLWWAQTQLIGFSAGDSVLLGLRGTSRIDPLMENIFPLWENEVPISITKEKPDIYLDAVCVIFLKITAEITDNLPISAATMKWKLFFSEAILQLQSWNGDKTLDNSFHF